MLRTPFSPRRWLLPALLTLLLTVAGLAQAHWADLAAAEIVFAPLRTELTLTVPSGLLEAADRNADGALDAAELTAARPALEAQLAAAVRLEDELGRPATLQLEGAAEVPVGLGLAPGSHSTLFLVYTWDAPPSTVALGYDLFLPDAPNASLIVTAAHAGGSESFVLTPGAPRARLDVAAPSPWRQLRSFVLLGVEHILFGYDHLLFLLALLVIGGGGRRLVRLITAFTVAHSLTLSLAVLELVALPPRLVESVIALSIAWVAAENLLLGRSAERRERLLRRRGWFAFGFGLIHGLGFAGILTDLELPLATLPLSLFGFNLGVELGQIAVVATTFVLALVLRRLAPGWNAAPPLRRWASLGAGVAGLVWFVERAFPIL